MFCFKEMTSRLGYNGANSVFAKKKKTTGTEEQDGLCRLEWK